jgi:hypothetical protein
LLFIKFSSSEDEVSFVAMAGRDNTAKKSWREPLSDDATQQLSQQNAKEIFGWQP